MDLLKLADIFYSLAVGKISLGTELQEIKINNLEKQIFDLLMDVVKTKTPNTILRVAGGWIRDKLLGKESQDIDISINNKTGEQFAHLVDQYMQERGLPRKEITIVKANPEQSKHLATAMVHIFGIPIDFVNLRKETYAESRIPTAEFGTPEEDASRRDLTINALFYNINEGKVEDYVGGLEDLKNGIAKTPIDPLQTFIDDPLRILRSTRFAAKYNLELDPDLIKAANDPRVQDAFKKKVSQERIWKELGGEKLEGGEWKAGFLSGPNPERAARLLAQVGLRDILFGLSEEEKAELGITKGMTSFDVEQKNPHHDLTIWEHTLSVLEHLVKQETTTEQQKSGEDFLVRNLAALLHDIGKCDLCSRQSTEEGFHTYYGHAVSSAKIAEHVLRRMRAPLIVIKRVKKLIEEHMRLHTLAPDVSDKALRKFIKDMEDDWKNSVDLAISDAYGKMMDKQNPEIRKKYDEFAKRIDEIMKGLGGFKATSPLNGNDLILLGFKPGPGIGQALKALHEQLLEKPNMTKEEALEFVKSLKLI